MKKQFALLLFFIFPAFLLMAPHEGMAAAKGPSAKKFDVVASIFPVADMVRNVGGSRVGVYTLLPPGANEETYEPPVSAFKALSGARAFFMIGAGLEVWAKRLLAAAPSGIRKVVLSQGMPLIGEGPGGVANPHVWLDPVLAIGMVRRIENALSAMDPAGASYYRGNAARYIGRLKALDSEVRRTVSAFRIKSLVSFHAELDYFARRYGLRIAGVFEGSPGKEPTPRKLEALIKAIKEDGIRAVFTDEQLNPRPAQIIAGEAGVKVVMLDVIGGLPGRDSYIKMMEFNLARMKEVMG